MTIEQVQDEVAGHMDKIKAMFKPGHKITVLVRAPNDPEGRMDFMMGDDEPQEVMNMVARRMAGASR